MKCDELETEQWLDYGGEPMPCYPAKDVDDAIAELKDENRKLKRALYKACANWADVVAFDNTEGIGYDNSVAERWRKMESKCLKKAEEYK